MCGGGVSPSGRRRKHRIERHERYREGLYRYKNLLQPRAPRLAYRPEPSTSPRVASRWACKVLSSGEVLHVRVAEKGETV